LFDSLIWRRGLQTFLCEDHISQEWVNYGPHAVCEGILCGPQGGHMYTDST